MPRLPPVDLPDLQRWLSDAPGDTTRQQYAKSVRRFVRECRLTDLRVPTSEQLLAYVLRLDRPRSVTIRALERFYADLSQQPNWKGPNPAHRLRQRAKESLQNHRLMDRLVAARLATRSAHWREVAALAFAASGKDLPADRGDALRDARLAVISRLRTLPTGDIEAIERMLDEPVLK